METKLKETHIFILSGQSNMAGRGGVYNGKWDEVVPPECIPNPCILRFSSKSKWVEANEPLHADIDVTKVCGVGPGMAFANNFLSTTNTKTALIGLVPCAIGGTAIAKWEKGEKLYSDMITRANSALDKAGCGGEIKGVLWYQGESDTNTKSHADVYKAKMEKLISDVRSDLGLPSLPFIQVALASGEKKDLIEQVREAQLGIDLPNVFCVDAKGLPLKSDHLHLTTDAQVVLGEMLAGAYITNFCASDGGSSEKTSATTDKKTSVDGFGSYYRKDIGIYDQGKEVILNLIQPEASPEELSKVNYVRQIQTQLTSPCIKCCVLMVLGSLLLWFHVL